MASWVKPGTKPNPLRGQADIQLKPIPNDVICFSFAHLDQSQGQTLEEWEAAQKLSQMLTRFRHHGIKRISECFHPDTFKAYKQFPPRSDFKHPGSVPPDARWASMHLSGKVCVAGHIVQNIFFVVFLDQDHRFWITEKRS